MAIGKKVGRHSPRHGWNPDHDMEWQYRKTLEKSSRDIFDYELDDKGRQYYINRWIKRGCKASDPHDEIEIVTPLTVLTALENTDLL